MLAVTALGDAAFFAGAFGASTWLVAAARYGREAEWAATTARVAKTNRAAVALARQASAYRIAATQGSMAAGSYLTKEGIDLAVVQGSAFDWRDWVPGFATKKALDEMRAACAK